jgi:hypothetical protein
MNKLAIIIALAFVIAISLFPSKPKKIERMVPDYFTEMFEIIMNDIMSDGEKIKSIQKLGFSDDRFASIVNNTNLEDSEKLKKISKLLESLSAKTTVTK